MATPEFRFSAAAKKELRAIVGKDVDAIMPSLELAAAYYVEAKNSSGLRKRMAPVLRGLEMEIGRWQQKIRQTSCR